MDLRSPSNSGDGYVDQINVKLQSFRDLDRANLRTQANTEISKHHKRRLTTRYCYDITIVSFRSEQGG